MSVHPSAESLAMHALDLLEPAEEREVHAHLQQCAVCRDEVGILRDSAALLAESVPALSPPPALRAQILERVRIEPRDALLGASPSEGSSPRKSSSSESAPRVLPMRTQRTRLWPVLAAAGLLLTLVSAGALQRAWTDRRDLRTELSLVQSIAEQRGTALAERDSLLARLLAPDVEIATLVSTESAPRLRLYRDRARGELVVAAQRLPPAPAGQTYQLWGIGASGAPVGLGTFNTAADGSAVLVLTVAPGLEFDVSAVTQEPTGGSPAPTSTPFLVGRWGD